MNNSVKEKIRNIVGRNNYFDSEEEKRVYSFDATPIFEQKPEAIIFPEDEEQISKIVRLANDEKFNIVPRGAGTGLSGGAVPVENCVLMVMTRWNKILEVDAKEFDCDGTARSYNGTTTKRSGKTKFILSSGSGKH